MSSAGCGSGTKHQPSRPLPNRLVRDGILTSARINVLSAHEEVFYRRLLSVVDDYGRYFALPGLLIAACYPLRIKTVTERGIETLLTALNTAGLIVLYEVKGSRYLQVLDFRQQIRAKKSKFPDRDGEAVITAPTSAAPQGNPSQERKRTLPPEWQPAEKTVQRLADEFRFTNGDAERYLQAFRDACTAKGYKYVDFDAAFSNCVRADWPKFRNGAATMPQDSHMGKW